MIGPGRWGRAVRIGLLHFRISAMNDMQYRVNFFVQLAQSVLALGTGLIVLSLVFARTDSLKGWSRDELLVVMGVFTLMGGVIGTFVQPAMQRLLADVREGTLDHVLTRPVDAQLLVSVREIRIWQSVDIAVGAAVIVVALVRLGDDVGWGHAGAFVALLGAGAITIYCFWLILSTGSFWLVRMDEVHELFQGVYRAGQYPVVIYPPWLRWSLTFLVPLGFAITVPSQALTGRLNGGAVAVAAAATAGMVIASRAFWRFGLRHYSGASA